MTPRGPSDPAALPSPSASSERFRAFRGPALQSALQVLPAGCGRPRTESSARHRVAAIMAACTTRHGGIGGPIPKRATRAAARLKGLEPVGGLGQGCPGREPRASPGSPGCAALDVLARATRELRRTTQPLGQLLA